METNVTLDCNQCKVTHCRQPYHKYHPGPSKTPFSQKEENRYVIASIWFQCGDDEWPPKKRNFGGLAAGNLHNRMAWAHFLSAALQSRYPRITWGVCTTWSKTTEMKITWNFSEFSGKFRGVGDVKKINPSKDLSIKGSTRGTHYSNFAQATLHFWSNSKGSTRF